MGTPDWYARRALLRAAVFGVQERERWKSQPAIAASVAVGVLAQVRDDAIVVDSSHGTELFAVSPSTVTWIGARVSPFALRPGDPVIIRQESPDAGLPDRRVAERIWARIGRVTGAIASGQGSEFLVDTHGQGRQRVVIASASWRQIQVRFPRLAPGYLLDVIGTRHHDYLLAVAPATAQPPYRADQPPGPPLVSGPVVMPVSGSAVWHEPGGEPPGLLGLGYPALEPEAGDGPAGGGPVGGTGCVRLPYLSLGSAVHIRNECGGRTAILPVTSEGVTARQFCDRCVECGTSPRGRVADLTMVAFVALGGNLEAGCFNATLSTMSVLTGVIVNEVSMVAIVREVDILLLAVLLIGGCAAKARYTLQMTTAGPGSRATATFPLMPHRCAATALCAFEFALGAALLLTAGGAWAGTLALTVRVAVVLLFGTAAGALYVLRALRPDAGCGCFGDLSRTPVGRRVIVRAALLFLAALSAVGAPPLRMPASAGQAWFALAVIVGELAVLFALSPEVGQFMLRLSHSDPCEVREVPVSRTLATLRASALWRRYQRFLVTAAPIDIWREGCWRFVVYPGVLASRRVEVVFAVHLAGRRVPVRVGMLDTGSDLGDYQPLQLSKLI